MAVLIACLQLWSVKWYGCGIDGQRVGRGPIQKVLVGLIPPSCAVGCRLELSPYLPVAFHDYSPHDVCHEEHSQICGDGTGRGGGTNAASPDLDGSCKICHL